jgi:UDP-glucose 4-epimerase
LGTGVGHSVHAVIAAVEDVTGRPVPKTVGPRRPGDPPALVASPEKARTAFGWVAQRADLRTMVADAYAFHRTQVS